MYVYIYTHRVTLIDTQNVGLRGSIIHRYMCIYIYIQYRYNIERDAVVLTYISHITP